MYPAAFEYLEPQSLQEAVDFLCPAGEDARILAGGQSLIPLMKLRLARPKYLIDLNRVAGLNYVQEREGCLMIGALTRHADIESSPLVRAKIPLMREAVSVLGDLQVRNLGTAGGAVVEADPRGMGPGNLGPQRSAERLGPRSEREIKATDFYTFAYTTALQSDELVREIAFQSRASQLLGGLKTGKRVAGDFAVASVAVQADIDKDRVCCDIGIGLGGAGECPVKAAAVETMLRGQRLSPEMIERAGRRIFEIASPIGDLQGSPEYKKEVLKVIFCRALAQLLERR